MSKKKTTEQFILDATTIHGTKYIYDEVIYKHALIKVKIICPIHTSWLQKPNVHLAGRGCPQCGGKAKSNTPEFIKKAVKIHGDRYCYDQVNYSIDSIKIKIICKEHGPFLQTPNCHLKGQNCPRCTSSISKDEVKWLDLMGVPNDCNHRNFTIFIDSRRFRVDGIYNNTIYEFYGDYWHGNPKIYSHNIVNEINGKTFGELYSNTIEREGLLKQAGYNFVSIWESDYRNN